MNSLELLKYWSQVNYEKKQEREVLITTWKAVTKHSVSHPWGQAQALEINRKIDWLKAYPSDRVQELNLEIDKIQDLIGYFREELAKEKKSED